MLLSFPASTLWEEHQTAFRGQLSSWSWIQGCMLIYQLPGGSFGHCVGTCPSLIEIHATNFGFQILLYMKTLTDLAQWNHRMLLSMSFFSPARLQTWVSEVNASCKFRNYLGLLTNLRNIFGGPACKGEPMHSVTTLRIE